MDRVTQSTAAAAEETASAAEGLKAQADALGQAVNDLEQLIGSNLTVSTQTASGGALKTYLGPKQEAPLPGAPILTPEKSTPTPNPERPAGLRTRLAGKQGRIPIESDFTESKPGGGLAGLRH